MYTWAEVAFVMATFVLGFLCGYGLCNKHRDRWDDERRLGSPHNWPSDKGPRT